jgi:hypothetical protein
MVKLSPFQYAPPSKHQCTGPHCRFGNAALEACCNVLAKESNSVGSSMYWNKIQELIRILN